MDGESSTYVASTKFGVVYKGSDGGASASALLFEVKCPLLPKNVKAKLYVVSKELSVVPSGAGSPHVICGGISLGTDFLGAKRVLSRVQIGKAIEGCCPIVCTGSKTAEVWLRKSVESMMDGKMIGNVEGEQNRVKGSRCERVLKGVVDAVRAGYGSEAARFEAKVGPMRLVDAELYHESLEVLATNGLGIVARCMMRLMTVAVPRGFIMPKATEFHFPSGSRCLVKRASDGVLFESGVDDLDLLNGIGRAVDTGDVYSVEDAAIYVQYKKHLCVLARANRRFVGATWKLIMPVVVGQVSKLRGEEPVGFGHLTKAKSSPAFISRLSKLICMT